MAKRFTKPSIDWAELGKRVPNDQKGKFIAFKGKSESYLRRVLALPESPPKIDWEAYRKMMPVAGLVDTFQKNYESYNVPYPPDPLSKSVDDQWASIKTEIEQFVAKSNNAIKEAEAQLAIMKTWPPVESITMEMYRDLYPELAIDPVSRPTFWPHDDAEQGGFPTSSGLMVAEPHSH